MQTSPCVPCCTTPQTVNVPGVGGDPGADGSNGINGFSLLTNAIQVPAAAGNQLTALVNSTLWMVIGGVVIIGQGQGAALANPGPATFRIVSIPSSTSVVLSWLDAANDVAALSTIDVGAVVSASGELPSLVSQSVYCTGGTPYVLTATPTLVDFGTSKAQLALPATGSWLLLSRVRYDFVAWRSTSKNITSVLKVDGGASISNSSTVFGLPDTSGAAVSYTAGIVDLPPVVYSATAGDVIDLLASLSATASVSGDVKAIEASIVAIKIA